MKLTKKYTIVGTLIILLGITFFTSCSTKKNTFTRRAYHNLTSHYNVYWNGMDNIRQGIKEYQASIKDNFSVILPIYNYGDRNGANKISQYTDISIKKASKAINKHSMIFNRKEYVRWIDDAYLLIGKCYFYKQDYPMARRYFEFVIKTYNENEIKYEAMLWLAQANTQLGDFNRAEPMLDMLLSKVTKGEAPSKYETDINLTYAQFYILQKNYTAAIPYITRALELKPSHTMRIRCSFILGQIYQKNGDLEEASRQYAYTVKNATTYDLEFNAKINMAQCYDSKNRNREFIVKKLTKMIKDEKNKDFLDQVYYALAHIALKDADTASAIPLLKKSVTSSTTNNYQKAISSMELADICFSEKDYTLAQAYYDSTMQFLPKDYPNYKELAKKTMTLTDLVTNLQVISKQDSLQKLAGMSEEQRNKVLDQIIGVLIAQELKKKQEEQSRQENQNFFGQNKSKDQEVTGSKEGRWYFYNPTIMSNGFSTFMRKWGRRKIEDNWFLTDKTVVSFANNPETTDSIPLLSGDTSSQATKTIQKSNNPKERAFYLPDIPLTPEKIQASNEKIIQAYYQAGFIYSDGLNDYSNAIMTFETLLERFPENKFKIPSDYELYLLYKQLENQPKGEFYKNLILSNYPESDYAKLLVNPNYYKEINARQSEASHLYNDTYQAFTKQQYYMVINNADLARTKFHTDSILMPKFDFLRALAIGKIEVVDSLVVAMSKITKQYPKSDVKPLAADVLAFLSTQKDSKGQPIAVDSTTVKDITDKIYKYDPNAVNFYVIIVNGDLVDVDALKIKITDYNTKYYDLDNLMVNSLLLDNVNQMVTVNNFEGSEKAVEYYLGIKNSKYIFTKLENAGAYYNFVISLENYPIFYRNKDISQYIRFFEKNYPIPK
ncbi:MAG: tetratricopeptide repeat protein [Bacteroidales bacterium]|nr:tetratricopeptide repeat protein [Bacteroidales bacterium]